MFGFSLESRAEGVAAIDPSGNLSDVRFPSGGTVGHCALLVLAYLGETATPLEVFESFVVELGAIHNKHWSKDLTGAPDRLTREVLMLLTMHQLVQVDEQMVTMLPAARRFAPEVTVTNDDQGSLW
jgi:uncharacterized protein (TIGR02678 family)